MSNWQHLVNFLVLNLDDMMDVRGRKALLNTTGFSHLILAPELVLDGSPLIFCQELLLTLHGQGQDVPIRFLEAVRGGYPWSPEDDQTFAGFITLIGEQGDDFFAQRSGRPPPRYQPAAGEMPQLFFGVPELPRFGLVGREQLLHELLDRLRSGGAVSLAASGQGGVGKTALAAAAAYHPDLLDHFSDGVLWASVGPGGDALLELGRWAEVLKLDPPQFPAPADLKRAVKNAIGRRKLLLVLDDIWEDDHADLLRCGGPFCAHLLTTRKNHIAHTFAGGAPDAMFVPDLES
ncbi:MAG: NB-ARC domain-containing protein, partial [Candidatus Promineifilaceae bacterium]|nr:NB-ARC domain-containing protein [Candidatus Promineifilaceae bacterium]